MAGRRLAMGCGVGLLVVVGVAAAGGFLLHDTAKPASIQEAVQRFKAGGAGGGKLDGVYVYATKGGESIDALGGAHHLYPATTSITAVGAPCGVKLRWDALQGRSTTWTLCSTRDGVELGTEEVVHTFFGQADDTTYACGGSELLHPGTFRCRSGRGQQTGTVLLVGRGHVEVGGKPVSVLHVRTVASISGGDHGTETVDWWLGTATGLPVRVAFTSRTSRKTFVGRVHYAENADLRLTSLRPKR
ncbi:MAG: hypothetical protein ACXVZ3_06735 [Gaiellaceae bacterium]